MNNFIQTGIITLEDLPSNDYIQFKEELLYKLIKISSKIAGNLIKLSELLNIHVGKLLKFTSFKNRRQNISIKDFKKIYNFLIENNHNINLQNKIKSIGRHKGILNPKFPLDFNKKEACAFIADILTDGGIDQRSKTHYANSEAIQIIYNLNFINKLLTNKDLNITDKEIAELNKNPLNTLRNIAKTSNIKCKIFKIAEKVYSIRYHRCLGRLLMKLNIPKGSKIYNNPCIPHNIKYTNKKSLFKFLERIFINEAEILKTRISISHAKNITNEVPNKLKQNYLNNPKIYCKKLRKFIKNNKIGIPNLIKDYQYIFNKIRCKVREPHLGRIYLTQKNEIHVSWELYIQGKNLDIIKENCDLNSSIKWSDLKLRDNFTTRYKPKDRLAQILKTAQKLKIFKSNNIKKELNLSIATITTYLKEPIKNNIIIKEGKGKNTIYKINYPPRSSIEMFTPSGI